MRIATLGLLAVLASASGAAAADLDYGYLRGAEDDYVAAAPVDWSGFYVGGHGGYSSSAMGYKNSFQTALADYFRGSTVQAEYNVSYLPAFPSRRADGGTYGAFVGYNIQLDDAVVGFEFDYTHINQLTLSAAGPIGRSYTLSSGGVENVAIEGRSAVRLEDYGTLRGRLGYAFGSFLPYVTGGVAIGRASTVEGAIVLHSGSNFYQLDSVGARSKTTTIAGAALGAGVEFAITPSIILRGEYQYVLFDDFDGHKINVNTVRGGAAVKF